MPRISIVIPTSHNTEALETTLLSVLEHRPPRSEVVVALGCVYADPYDLKQEIRFVHGPRPASLVGLVNCGIAAAGSEVVHVLACGATVGEGWTTSAMGRFADPRIAAVAAMVLAAATPPRLLAAGLTWSRGGRAEAFGEQRPVETVVAADRYWVGPHLAGAFYRRSALVECGSFDAGMSANLAAIDLALRLRQAGKQCVLDCESKIAVDPKLLPAETTYGRARDAERLFWRHVRDHARGRRILAHGLHVAGDLLRDIPHPRLIARLSGRVAGLVRRETPELLTIPPLPEPAANAPTAGSARRVDAAHHGNEKPQASGRRTKSRRAWSEL